jgi:hypothetical protein
MKFLETLNQAELQQLEDAIPQIAILIAGADGTIDEEERQWADKLAHIRAFAGDKVLHDFYNEVHSNFSIRFNDMLKTLPKDLSQQQQILSDKLAILNPILAKIDPRVAYHVYKSMTSYAKSIAEESGGFFRIGSISKAEQKWINLPMLTPIEEPAKEEEQ